MPTPTRVPRGGNGKTGVSRHTAALKRQPDKLKRLEPEQVSGTENVRKVNGSGIKTMPRQKIDPPPPKEEPKLPEPVHRRLLAYAFDPSFATSYKTYEFNRVTLEIPWEPLTPGPTGEYLEVIDPDPSSGCFYPAVNLDHPHLLATDGLPPSVGSPMFHQQMVYAVAMRTIRNFELALGRRVQWSPKMQGKDDSGFVPRLRIYPHALRERNAYYDPSKKALLFGYFAAEPEKPGETVPGEVTFACLSHDIVAHETTHAILDGIYRNLNANNPTNEDQLAFHEAFADLVALLQHFTITSVVESRIGATQGKLTVDNALLQLAREFGQATGMHGALRTAIGGGADPSTGQPDYSALGRTSEVHDRGAILVAAVFDAFLNIYTAKTEDLRRIASAGTGLLPEGQISPDLVHRFAAEASTLASQFLLICIRAIDYCPPVDLTFGDYLRALITADHDLVPSDPNGYRVAIAESFRKRGILPPNLATFGEETLLWRCPEPETDEVGKLFQDAGKELEGLDQLLHHDAGPGQRAIPVPGSAEKPGARETVFHFTREARRALHEKMKAYIVRLSAEKRDVLGHQLGLNLKAESPSFEVHTVALAQRQGPDGTTVEQFVVTLVQSHNTSLESGDSVELLSGSTVLLQRSDHAVKYIIYKRPTEKRLGRNKAFALAQMSMGNPYFMVPSNQRFALVHQSGGFFNE